MKHPAHSAVRCFRYLLGPLLLTTVLFFTIEGVASTASVLRQATALTQTPTDHLEYDPELGWVGKPNVKIENAYGPGKHITRNALGFRGTKDIAVEVSSGKTRSICLGDSLTFGFLLGDGQSWCDLLEQKDKIIETVNMAEPAYGVDQMYLRYKRDGSKLKHNILLMGIATMYIDRMASDMFSGMPKPILTLENDNISIMNIPVSPIRPSTARQILASAAVSLRITPFLQSIFFNTQEQETVYTREELKKILSAVLRDTNRIATEQGASLVVMHLPVYDDQNPNTESSMWGATLDKVAKQEGFSFFPLVHDFQHLSPQKTRAMFIEEFGHTHGPVHYNEKGYEWIAEKVYEYLHHKHML